MISNNFKLPFRFKLPSSPSEAFSNIKNNLCSMAGVPKIIFSGILSCVAYLDASNYFYSEYLIKLKRYPASYLKKICYIQKNNQTFLIDIPEAFLNNDNYLGKIKTISIAAGAGILLFIGVVQVCVQGRKIYKLSSRKLLLQQNFLLNTDLEKTLKREDDCLNWVKLAEALVALSAGLTLGISAWLPTYCIQIEAKFSRYHCVNFSKVMYVSSILFFTEAGLLLFLKAYGPSKKEQIFLKLEQCYGVRGIIRRSDLSYIGVKDVKIIINEEEDAETKASLKDINEWNLDDEGLEEVFYLAKQESMKDFYNPKKGRLANEMLQKERDKLCSSSLEKSVLSNQQLDKKEYPSVVDDYFDHGPLRSLEEEDQIKIVNISMSTARKLQQMHIPCMVFGQGDIDWSIVQQDLKDDIRGLCTRTREQMVKAFLGRRGLLRSRVIERTPIKKLKLKEL
ncbi:hypothetical protein CLAVI_000956 [Candidatus Clavichlamydia salmonicola]|uniref:hypothetical protein n=1 Tax=Candidatus Clavichlamydia salmonicola TaxID=469812 RepID=UPI001891C089|nr:hypothetical protein [Candidatus Clavichlamydia salmonicola]MBF5051315.1 hypothetical protein [Candidatus Clavichlamydia salmonicola]